MHSGERKTNRHILTRWSRSPPRWMGSTTSSGPHSLTGLCTHRHSPSSCHAIIIERVTANVQLSQQARLWAKSPSHWVSVNSYSSGEGLIIPILKMENQGSEGETTCPRLYGWPEQRWALNQPCLAPKPLLLSHTSSRTQTNNHTKASPAGSHKAAPSPAIIPIFRVGGTSWAACPLGKAKL